jgi:hypothetical protein
VNLPPQIPVAAEVLSLSPGLIVNIGASNPKEKLRFIPY